MPASIWNNFFYNAPCPAKKTPIPTETMGWGDFSGGYTVSPGTQSDYGPQPRHDGHRHQEPARAPIPVPARSAGWRLRARVGQEPGRRAAAPAVPVAAPAVQPAASRPVSRTVAGRTLPVQLPDSVCRRAASSAASSASSISSSSPSLRVSAVTPPT